MRAVRFVFPKWEPLVLSCALLLAGLAPSNDGGLSVCAQSPKPNIVLFLADDMGYTDWQYDAQLNPTGSVVYETPNLLRLAQQSVNFTNAYAAAPICSPTRAALMTGKTPARTHITDYLPGSNQPNGLMTANLREPCAVLAGASCTVPGWTRSLPQAEITLAESLSSAAGGYATGFFGKWHLGPNAPTSDPLQNGFQVNVAGSSFGNPDQGGGYFAGTDGMWNGMPGLNTPGTYPSDKYLSDAIDEKAVDYIAQQANQANPFFLEMPNYLVHTNLAAPASLVTKYQNKILALQGQGVDLKGHTNATYAAMVEKMDESVGRLLDRLEDPDGNPGTNDSVRNNTIFVFTSDNGGVWGSEGSPTSNQPLREGKGSLYEGGLREPLMVSWMGNSNFAQGSVTNAKASTYDLYPTLLDLTGLQSDVNVPRNSNMDGVSIRAALEGGPFDRGYLYWHYPHVSPQDNTSTQINGGSFVSAAVNGDWKLMFFYEDRHYELYNLAADIGETTNLLSLNPAIAHDMSASLNAYLISAGAQMPIDRNTGLAVAAPTVLPTQELGDYNLNSVVDFGDYNTWKMTYGSKTLLAADGNRNGIVDAADYTVWRNLFHASGSGTLVGGSGSGGSTVPEPAAWELMALASLYLAPHLRLRHKRRSAQ